MIIQFGREQNGEFEILRDVRVKGSIAKNRNNLFNLIKLHGSILADDIEGKRVSSLCNSLSYNHCGDFYSTYRSKKGDFWRREPVLFEDGTESDWTMEANLYNEGYIVRIVFWDKNDLYFLRNTKTKFKGVYEKIDAHVFKDEKAVQRYFKDPEHQRQFSNMVSSWNVKSFVIEHASEFYKEDHMNEDVKRLQEAQVILDMITEKENAPIGSNPYDEACFRMQMLEKHGLSERACDLFETDGTICCSRFEDRDYGVEVVYTKGYPDIDEKIQQLKQSGITPYHVIYDLGREFFLYVGEDPDGWRYERFDPLQKKVMAAIYADGVAGPRFQKIRVEASEGGFCLDE